MRSALCTLLASLLLLEPTMLTRAAEEPDAQAQEAIGLVNVDSHLAAEVLEEIRAIPAIRVARVVEV